jgi:hypothetical protein
MPLKALPKVEKPHSRNLRDRRFASTRIQHPASSFTEEGKLPLMGFRIVPKNVSCPVVALDLEIAMVRIEPPVNDLGNPYLSLIQPESPWGLFAPVS